MSSAVPAAVVAVQVRPPSRGRASSTMTCFPAAARLAAAASPETPAPMTSTSARVCSEPGALTMLFDSGCGFGGGARAARCPLLIDILAGTTQLPATAVEKNAAMVKGNLWPAAALGLTCLLPYLPLFSLFLWSNIFLGDAIFPLAHPLINYIIDIISLL